MDRLNEISPGLPGKGPENPFSIPEGYFEAFPGRLEERIRSKPKVPVRDHRILVLKPYLAAAILSIKHPEIADSYRSFREKQSEG